MPVHFISVLSGKFADYTTHFHLKIQYNLLFVIGITLWQHSQECMCHLWNKAMRDYQESVTTRQMDGRTDRQMPDKVIPTCNYALQAPQKPSADAGQSDPYVPLCFAGATKTVCKT